MDGEEQDEEEEYSNKKSSENSTGRRDSSEGQDDEEMGDGEDYENGVGDLPSPPEMKRELIQAILDETEEYRNLSLHWRYNEMNRQQVLLERDLREA